MTMEVPVAMDFPWEISCPPARRDIGVGCLENPKKEEVIGKTRDKRPVLEQVFGEFGRDGKDSSTLLLVWRGQPNDEEDDRQRKRRKSSCSLAYDGDCSEGAPVVGWPPIGSWRKKLVYQYGVPGQVGNVDNARCLQRRWNERSKCDVHRMTS